MSCPYGDTTCPCPDGDPCHYEDHGDTKAMTPPDQMEIRPSPMWWCDKHGITDYCITFHHGPEQKTLCMTCLEEALLKLAPTAIVQPYDARIHGRP